MSERGETRVGAIPRRRLVAPPLSAHVDMALGRKAILAAWTISLCAGVLALVSVFVAALNPTQTALVQYRKEFDVSSLKPGELFRGRWHRSYVFVLRRTSAQIQWLSSYEPPQLMGDLSEEEVTDELNNRYRSLLPEYFVAEVPVDDGRVLLREVGSYHACDEFKYFSNARAVGGSRQFPGGFYCASSYGQNIESLEESWMVYDVAGRAPISWVAPLHVPEHFFREDGTLVVGPST